jgi:hypothetical protein
MGVCFATKPVGIAGTFEVRHEEWEKVTVRHDFFRRSNRGVDFDPPYRGPKVDRATSTSDSGVGRRTDP